MSDNPKKIKIKCIGYDFLKNGDTIISKLCNNDAEGEKYCKKHEYLSKFTNNELQQLKDNTGEIVVCKGCSKWKVETKQCICCKEKRERAKIAKAKNKCKWFTCREKDTKEPCGYNKVNDTEYCEHHDYVCNYTDEMKEKSSRCSGCQKFKYCGGNATCDDCCINHKKLHANGRLKCTGMTFSKKKGTNICMDYQEDKSEYCKSHQYLNDFSKEDLEKIKMGELTACDRCSRWKESTDRHDVKSCKDCRERKNNNSNAQINHIEIIIKNDDNNKLNKNVENVEKVEDEPMDKFEINKCEWFDSNFDRCPYNKINDSPYCIFHGYVNDYSDEMKKQSRLCKKCSKIKYCGDEKKCVDCVNKRKQNRQKLIDKIGLCRYETSDGYKCHRLRKTDKGYCNKHKRIELKEEIESQNKKVCVNFIRGCNNTLEKDNKYNKCSECRKSDRETTNPVKFHHKSFTLRGIKNELSDEQIMDLSKMPCYYCNEMNDRKWNGIDRKNNNTHYTKDNSVPCCSMCNYMKRKLDFDDFIKYCKNISNNYPSNNFDILRSDAYVKPKYQAARKKCEDVNRNFVATFEEWKQVISNKCYYCNNTNCDKIGIDRMDQTKGYVKDNMVACCKICNIMKWTYNLEDFVQKTKLISNNRS